MSEQSFSAEIITIGHEVLSGHTVNTNAAEIARMLDEIGVAVHWVTTCGDVKAHMAEAVHHAWERAQIIIVTGGLGPTHDDITLTVFCELFDRALSLNQDVLDHIERMFASRGRTLSERNKQQANVPSGTTPLLNRWGTAPGVHLEEDGHQLFLLPGVPREMRGLMEHGVVPILSKLSGVEAIVRRELHVIGYPESYLMDAIEGAYGLEEVASLPDIRGQVNLRITVTAPTRQDALLEAKRVEAGLRERLGDAIYGADADTLESVVGAMLAERGLTLATAESCTGGLVSSLITDVPGSSRYFSRGIVAYSNEAKSELLGVPTELIDAHGAVSEEVARAMAHGARERASVDIAVSLTGIMGPTGGSDDKPVGLVYTAIADAQGTAVHTGRYAWDRVTNKRRTAQEALVFLRRRLLGQA